MSDRNGLRYIAAKQWVIALVGIECRGRGGYCPCIQLIPLVGQCIAIDVCCATR